MDKRWGHVTIAISGHPPFKTMVMLNGYEFTATMAKEHGLDFRKVGFRTGDLASEAKELENHLLALGNSQLHNTGQT